MIQAIHLKITKFSKRLQILCFIFLITSIFKQLRNFAFFTCKQHHIPSTLEKRLDEDVFYLRKISIYTVFYKSFYSFKDIAKYRFLSIGKTFQYVFLLVLFQFIPSLYNMLVLNENSALHLPEFDAGSVAIMLPIYILLMFVLLSGLMFLKISILAGITLLVGKMFKRKLPYRQSWRLTACSITLPTVLFGLLQLFPTDIPYDFLIDVALALFFMFISVQKIPKSKKI